jgi:hypothetical protein
MLTGLLISAMIGASSAEPINPDALALFDRDPQLHAWALKTSDENQDGWLTLYEAQAAVGRLKEVADGNKDGQVTVREFEKAKAFVAARWGVAPQPAR